MNGLRNFFRNGWTRFGIGMTAIGVLALALLGAPVTGANQSDTGTGHVDVSVKTLNLTLADGKGSQDTFDLDFPLEMNVEVVQSFRVLSAPGAFTGNVSIGQPVSGITYNVPAGQTPNLSQLMVKVDGYLNWTPVTALGNTVALGTIPSPGDQWYTLRLKLASAGDSPAGDTADNQWRNVTAGGDVTVKLRS